MIGEKYITIYIYIPVSLTLLSDHFMQTLERTDVEPSSHTMLCWEPEFRNAHQFPTPEITAPTTHHETKQKHVQSGDFGGFKVLMFPNHCSLVARNSLRLFRRSMGIMWSLPLAALDTTSRHGTTYDRSTSFDRGEGRPVEVGRKTPQPSTKVQSLVERVTYYVTMS